MGGEVEWRVGVSDIPFHYANIIVKRMDVPDINVYKNPELMVKLGKAWLEVSGSLKVDDPLSVESSADVVSFFNDLFLKYNSETIIIQFPTRTLPSSSSSKLAKNN